MLTFCGFDLELFVDEVLNRRDWPTVCCDHDFTGNQWLIVQVDDDPAHLAWLCAPASERAIQPAPPPVIGKCRAVISRCAQPVTLGG
jgi:hypothetical protein